MSEIICYELKSPTTATVLIFFGARLLVNLNYVFIHQLMIDSHSLRVEFNRATPHTRVRELVEKVFVNLHQRRLDCESFTAICKDEWI
jgi:hypothetical protein